VQRIIPEAVTEDDKGYLLVNNDPILWAMLNAIQEQQTQIHQQRQQIENERFKERRQQKLISSQQKELEALKTVVCRSHPHSNVCR
jgi:trimeric autotransporter adhesin